MKTNFTFLLAIAVALFSCKKDNSTPAGTKHPSTTAVTKYPVLFSASAFKSKTSAFSAKKKVMSVKQTQSLADQVGYLSYYVTRADSPAVIIKQVFQKSTDPDFGTIRDTLPNGNYKVVFLGATYKQVQVIPYSDNPFPDPSDLHLAISYNDFNGGQTFGSSGLPVDSIGDTFVKVLNLTVNGRSNYDVVMDRIIGKVNVVIQDAIPANVAYLQLSFEQFPSVYDLVTNSPQQGGGSGLPGLYYSHNVTPAEVGTKGFTFSVKSFPMPGFTIFLDGFDAHGKNLFERVVVDGGPGLTANTTLVFSGTLFSNSSLTNVTTNPVWGPSTTVPFTDY